MLSGSCAATMLHAWPELFEGDPRLAGVLERVVEFGALLAPLARATPRLRRERRPVAFHCSCHQRRYLGDTTSGEALLAAPGRVERVSRRAREDLCCGFGGTFAIKFAHVSGAMGRDKVAALDEAGAAELVSGDLGCLMHLDGCARATGSPLAATSLRGAARARGLRRMSGPVYDGDTASPSGSTRRSRDTRLTRHARGGARDDPGRSTRGEERHPDWAARVTRARAIRKDAWRVAPELLDRFEAASPRAAAA